MKLTQSRENMDLSNKRILKERLDHFSLPPILICKFIIYRFYVDYTQDREFDNFQS